MRNRGTAHWALLRRVAELRHRYLVVTVIGDSMAPTFRHGDRLLARRDAQPPESGDIVVFRVTIADYPLFAARAARAPGQPMLDLRVKRVVASAGDPAPYWMARSWGGEGGRVPADHVVVAGDAPESEGSQELGYIAHERIQGIIVRRLRTRRTTSVGPGAAAAES